MEGGERLSHHTSAWKTLAEVKRVAHGRWPQPWAGCMPRCVPGPGPVCSHVDPCPMEGKCNRAERCSESAFWCKMGMQLGWALLWDYKVKKWKKALGERECNWWEKQRKRWTGCILCACFEHWAVCGCEEGSRILSSRPHWAARGAQAQSAQHYLLTRSGLPHAAGRVLFSKRKVFYIKGLISKRHHFNLATAALEMHSGEQEKSTGRLLSENSFWKKLKFSWGM